MNANLLSKWLRDPKFAPDVASEGAGDVFLVVEVEAAPIVEQPVPTAVEPGTAPRVQRIDLTLSDGQRILVEGATELVDVLGLIKGLMA